MDGGGPAAEGDDLLLASRRLPDGACEVELSVPSVHCAACIASVERALARLPGVEAARVNLSTRRVRVRWRGIRTPAIGQALAEAGHPGHALDAPAGRAVGDPELAALVRALAVAGFAAGNIMLFSVSVWAGAEAGTRDVFHWLSALIALPAVLYAGRPFARSAWGALRNGRTNMDVPIVVGVALAYGMSLYDTWTGQPHAYFDATVTLLFFLLVGRALDRMMRRRAASAVEGLARLQPRGATVLDAAGRPAYRPLEAVRPGDRLIVAAGERVPVDGTVEAGRSEIDPAIATGEAAPVAVGPGARLVAGVQNLTGPLTLRAGASAADSFLAEMARAMAAAEDGRARYRRIADRWARAYAPAVHLAALGTLAGWWAATGDPHRALGIAVAVLIITCPCALGLAAPIVQVVAARRLFERGILMKDGAGLERLAEIDRVVFDKTGTLTEGRPRLVSALPADPAALALAGRLGALSRHPNARALAAAAPGAAEGIEATEHPGLGIEARIGDRRLRLGRADWALTEPGEAEGTVLSADGCLLQAYRFEDRLRPGAAAAVRALGGAGLGIEILSGDTEARVGAVARPLGIAEARAGRMPGEKARHLADLAAAGHRVLMVGDGLNDAPALAAAHVSMAPASAADVGRNAADFVFLHAGLEAVPFAHAIARRADRLVRQNFALAIGYNALALPVAIAGYVTPLVAALAMSTSSILVVANALRLSRGTRAEGRTPPGGVAPVDRLS